MCIWKRFQGFVGGADYQDKKWAFSEICQKTSVTDYRNV